MSTKIDKYNIAYDKVAMRFETVNDGSFSGFSDFADFLIESTKSDLSKAIPADTKKAMRDSIRD